MAGNTLTTVQSNNTFTTGVVTLAVGVLNPANSPQTIWDNGSGTVYASMTTVVTGSPASCTVVLEGTYDGNTWTILATSGSTTGDTQYAAALIPFTNLRARCTAVSGGSSPTINVYTTTSQTPFASQTGNGIMRVAAAPTGSTTSLNAATLTTDPVTVADLGQGAPSWTIQIHGAGTITAGAVTVYGSVDNTTFVPVTAAANTGSTAGVTLASGVATWTAAADILISSPNAGPALRYLKAAVTTNITGGGTVTAKILGG